MTFLDRFAVTPKRRSKLLIWGSLIAAVGILFPDLYEVTYAPWAPTPIPAARLHGIVGDFNGLNGPFHGSAILGSIIYLGILGFLVPYFGFDRAKELLTPVQKVLKYFSMGSGTTAGLVAIALFFWQFNGNGLPKDTTKAFITRQGGGASAVAESHYLSASLGACVFLVIGGLLIALGGFWPKLGGITAGLAGVAVLLLCAGLSLGVHIPGTTASQTIPAADGSRPHTTDSCSLAPGKDENCESVSPTVALSLPNPSPGATNCAYAITVDWGDHTTHLAAVAHGSASATLYTTHHTYRKGANAYALTVTEKVTAGSCRANPTVWKPQFAVAVRVFQ